MRKLNEVIDWDGFTGKLLSYYKGKGEIGQAPYNPTIILKMLLLSYLWNVSERMIEVLADDSLSIGFFLVLGADESAPDHSPLTLFENRLISRAGTKAYEELFDEIIMTAMKRRIKFGKLQVDSVHSIANVNLIKDERRKGEGKPPRGADACWGAKGNKLVVGKNGKKHKETEYFYGYEDQVSLNAETGLVTRVILGQANDYDGHKLEKLLEKDLRKGIDIRTVASIKGCDDGDNPYCLKEKGIDSAIMLNNYRAEKKARNKEGWVKLRESKEYQEGLKERYRIEGKFGEAKKWHGFPRSRYLGFVRHAIQSYLTFPALDLKRLVNPLTSLSFRGEARACSISRQKGRTVPK